MRIKCLIHRYSELEMKKSADSSSIS